MKRDNLKILTAFALIYGVWGSTYLANRIALDGYPPLSLLGLRFLIAGLLLYGWARMVSAQPCPSFRHCVRAAGLSTLMLVLGVTVVTWAQQTVDSGMTALMIATVPIWVVFWSSLGRRKWPPLTVMVGLFLGTAGVAVLLGPSSARGSGEVALVFAAASWGLGSVLSKKLKGSTDAGVWLGTQLLFAGCIVSVFALSSGERIVTFSLSSTLALLYLTLVSSILTFGAYHWLLQRCDPGAVATYAYVNPVIALFLGWWLAGEVVSGGILLGAAIVLLGVILVVSGPRLASLFPRPSLVLRKVGQL